MRRGPGVRSRKEVTGEGTSLRSCQPPPAALQTTRSHPGCLCRQRIHSIQSGATNAGFEGHEWAKTNYILINAMNTHSPIRFLYSVRLKHKVTGKYLYSSRVRYQSPESSGQQIVASAKNPD